MKTQQIGRAVFILIPLLLSSQPIYAFGRKAPTPTPAPVVAPSLPQISTEMSCSKLQGNEIAGTQCRTLTGSIFTKVQGPGSFGLAWKDPDGHIWSSDQGKYSNVALRPDQDHTVIDSPATEACARIGGMLPSVPQYKKLVSYLVKEPPVWFSADGTQHFDGLDLAIADVLTKIDIESIFPDLRTDESYWVSSVDCSEHEEFTCSTPSLSYFGNIASDAADGYKFVYIGNATDQGAAAIGFFSNEEYGREELAGVRCISE